MDMPVAVDVSAVGKTFPTAYGYIAWLRSLGRAPRRTVLSDISFAVQRGEVFGLLGANGAGKSTLLRMLSGIVLPDAGCITIEGADAIREPLELRRRIGLCTGEERSFYYRLSARANLEYFAVLTGVPCRELRARVEQVAAAVDLTHELDRRFDQFSAGMRQRLSFARALLGDPDVLLLDEPTRAVDPVHTYELRRFVRDELAGRQGKTIILATNVLEEAWELCDRIAVLRGGRIVTIASPAELGRMAASRRRYTIDVDEIDTALIARMNDVRGIVAFSHEREAEGMRLTVDLDDEEYTLTELLRAVSANGISILGVRPDPARPSDIFARLTDEDFDAR